MDKSKQCILSGGHYSLFRFIFSFYLLYFFFDLITSLCIFCHYDASESELNSLILSSLAQNLFNLPVQFAILISSLLSFMAVLCFMFGCYDRAAALVLAYTYLLSQNSAVLIDNSLIMLVPIILLVHCFLPLNPWGSFDAKRKGTLDYDWGISYRMHGLIWIGLFISYGISLSSDLLRLGGVMPLDAGAQLLLHNAPINANLSANYFIITAILKSLFLISSFSSYTRRVGWWITLILLYPLLLFAGHFDHWGLLFLHLLAFNQQYVKPNLLGDNTVIFYDGTCGVCHGFIRFLLSEDKLKQFNFSALEGQVLTEKLSAAERANLPDSLVLISGSKLILTKSAAIILILKALGGFWKVFAYIFNLLPAFILDKVYDLIAFFRKRISKSPQTACPVLDQELQSRFI